LPVTVSSRFVMLDGVKTHYTESGSDGPVILGLHGGGHGSSGLAGLGRLFDLLGERYRVIGLDSIGGYGETDPTVPLTYGLQSRVDHCAEFVDALCLDRFTIMGNSQGAWCAARYAILHPDRVESVVMVSSNSIGTALGISSPPSEGLKLLQGYDGTPAAMRRLLEGLIYNKDKITDALLERRQKAATRPGAMETFSASEKSIRAVRTDPILAANYDMRATLPILCKQIPCAFIWGENDVFAVPEIRRQVEKMLPDAAFHWLQGAGHQVQTDQPELVAEIVDQLIRKTSERIPAPA
jgi:pimeloyl-ACP methyl ester carboxylesterase